MLEFIRENIAGVIIITPMIAGILFMAYIVIQREFFDKDE